MMKGELIPRAFAAGRREFLLALAGALAGGCAARSTAAPAAVPGSAAAPPSSFRALEQRAGGRLGVCVLDTGSGREWAQRADERFALCSTFKWLLAALVLSRVERGELALDTRLAFGAADLLEHAPVCREHVGEGSLSIRTLAQAAVEVSDNTAANLLLVKLGGPGALTQFCRSLGDEVTRLDRYEGALNENAPGDERDTTTPRAMTALMQRLLCTDAAGGSALSAASRETLLGWLRASRTGMARLRAGLPTAWNAGDKTGTGQRGACNDVAIAFPPGRAPVLLAVYLSDGESELSVLEAVHADVARTIVGELVGSGVPASP